MQKPTIFVTRRWPKETVEEMKKFFEVTINQDDRPLTQSEIADGFESHDALAPTVSDNIDQNIIKKGSGKIIANYGVGFSHIDLEACKENNVTVTNTPDVLTDATADLTILLMLMISRRAIEGAKEIETKSWMGWRPTHLVGSDLSGKTLGIIGMGRIGEAVAKRALFGFKMKIIFYNRSKKDNLNFKAEQVKNITEIFEKSDFISLHCPGGNNNKNIINEKSLQLMKKSTFLINTARGELIEENSLCKALNNDQIAGAGLDVYNNEPDINPKLLKTKNVVLLPHLGSATSKARNAMGFKVIENLKSYFNSGKGIDIVKLH